MEAIESGVLPGEVTSRFVDGVNGMRMHILEAGEADRPLLLLLHGFPELAFSWRKVMTGLAAAGYRVVAPDQRGFGRTTGWTADYDAPLEPYGMLNLSRDALALVRALGYEKVAGVFGHDFGASVAAYCALIRPDVFARVAVMSGPFSGPPAFPFDTDGHTPSSSGRSILSRNWLPWRDHASTITTTTARVPRTTTCSIARKGSTISSAGTSTARAPTGRGTIRIVSRRGGQRTLR